MLKDEVYKNSTEVLDHELVGSDQAMTINGAVNKTLILTGIMLVTATFSALFANMLFFWVGLIGGAIVYFIAARNPQRAGTLAPIYAALEGLIVGTASIIYASAFEGIIFHAVTLTIGVLLAMLFIYKTGIIKVTEKFRAGVSMAVGAVMILYLVNLVLYFFGINMPFLHEAGPIGIGISLVIIGIAAMNLLLDFDNFEKGEQYQAPKYMEWYSAMGLLFTLVWIYLEILHLIAMLQSSD